MAARNIHGSPGLQDNAGSEGIAGQNISTTISSPSAVGASHEAAQHTSPNLELDSLYHLILSSSPEPDKNLLQVLSAILILPSGHLSPSPKCIELVLGLPLEKVDASLRAMNSLLFVRGQEDEIRFLHTSFTDYLLDRKRSGKFYVDLSAQKHEIAREWLRNLAASEMESYSSEQLNGDNIKGFFTGWIDFCASLPRSTTDLLDELRHVDLAAVFSCKYGYRVQDTSERETVTRDWQELFGGLVPWVAKADGGGEFEVQGLVRKLSSPPGM
ncbi:hypothetical protein PQX77_001782 [Marasmius sp. AFHP31]|nr:hypothetical protein PQX77_001782 [Marasmius sp. AFHP31]